MGSIERIARRIAAVDNGNELDKVFRFYNDGKFVVEKVRDIQFILTTMGSSMESYLENIPKLEEDARLVGDVKMDEMGSQSCATELKAKVNEIKRLHSLWEKAQPNDKARLSEAYNGVVLKLKDYIDSYESTCVDTFRNRYVADEDNVRNLLDVIRSAGDSVMNKRTGGR